MLIRHAENSQQENNPTDNPSSKSHVLKFFPRLMQQFMYGPLGSAYVEVGTLMRM